MVQCTVSKYYINIASVSRTHGATVKRLRKTTSDGSRFLQWYRDKYTPSNIHVTAKFNTKHDSDNLSCFQKYHK